jgi:hypothetical protein
MLLVVLSVSDNVIDGAILPDVFSVFLIAKSFEG